MGHDWNGDGQHDWRDDALYHTVINNENENGSSTNKSNQQQTNKKPTETVNHVNGGLAFDILSLLYLSVLIPGDIGVNWFTMTIGLVCAIRLGYSFLKWLYK